ncbi:sigma factor-like helix-turn-helix DNA-binding protein, partial [Pseudomonas syringae group genomosp. 7]|uniref:sigma factor-like helix-turn-helix DNA-binding protein n=1 Tax=Pseudomonas syringae group genomosp. 7 TaxID=251699 RepID=UPI00377017DA
NKARVVRTVDDVREDHHEEATLECWEEFGDAFDWRVIPGRITACLGQLEPVRRNCVFQAYVDGYSHQEIALKVGAPLGT